MKKRIIAWILSLMLLVGLFPGTAQAAESMELRVWAAYEDMDWLYRQLDAFEAANPQWNITWDVGVCPAGDANSMMHPDPAAGADVFFFASDQCHELVDLGALLALDADETAVALAHSSQSIMNTVKDSADYYYGYPVSSNTWFMYYNKSVFSEEDVKSLETMLQKGTVAFEICNSWHLPAFYFANGCTLFGADGCDEAAGARFGGKRGTDVTLRLLELLQHPNFIIDGDGRGNAGLKDGSVDAYFSGTWDYAGLYEALGEDLGAAQPPTVRIDGQDKQLLSYLASQAIGINGHTRHEAAARALAQFLATPESQLLRWNADDVYKPVPAAASLATDPSITANAAAVAQMNTHLHASRVQPGVQAMDACWGPIGTFGFELVNGLITPQNAAQKTEELNTDLNGGETPPPFTDVPAGAWYENSVLWALENGITTGATDTTFNPNGQCLRAQVVTFLLRAAKSPEPTSTVNPFNDVKSSNFFYKSVLWAVEKGITNGVSANKFGSYDVCNRAAVVTFLWRAMGSPEPESAANPFKDVKTTDFFYKPVLWAVENGITNGLTATEFGPNAACNRAQVVTFLYRAYND